MIALIALILELVGVAFLVVATIGVIRFPDPFQRMHAATKAGTVGAGLVLAGTAFSQDSTAGIVISLLTMLFLVATMPVAGHLLGRAFYISGAPLLSQQDALKGVLPRMKRPLEERHHDIRAARNATAAKLKADARARKEGAAPGIDSGIDSGVSREAGYDAVRFAVIAPDAGRIARRAQMLAAARNVPLTGVAVIDEGAIGLVRSPDADAREVIRARLAEAVAETRAATAGSKVPLALSYEEGDPLALIPGDDVRELLLLPTAGWCHHGAPLTLPANEDALADKLFVLADRHKGPTLFVGTAAESKQSTGTAAEGRSGCIVVHDGSDKIQSLAVWALKTRLWPLARVTIAGPATSAQIQALTAAAKAIGASVLHLRRPKAPAGALLPARQGGAAALILAELPQPARVTSDGAFWQDRLIPGFRGDVLVG
jgi:monovalent cation/proton antiporter MnhG/PhaG subunit